MKYALIRCPSMMEDEGQYDMYGVYATKDELLTALDKATNGDTGFFREFDFCWGELRRFNDEPVEV